MAQCPPLLTRLLASSVTASAHAGKIIRDVLSKGELNIVEKGKNDLQTEADRSAQMCIIESLTRQFPNVSIIGEEGTSKCEVPSEWIIKDMDPDILKLKLPTHLENIEPKDVCVWVDPLDGTSEYTQGLVEHVTVLVGVAVGDRAVGGVIHQPYYRDAKDSIVGRTLWGIEGVGTGGFKTISPPEGKRIITTTRSHSNKTVQAALDALKPDEVLRVGGAGHKVILLLEGKAHAYVFASAGCKRWDTCAPEAILHAIGGKLTDLYGDLYSYKNDTPHSNSRGVLATAPGQIHSWYVSRIPDEVKQQLPQ
ncbi:3'(2'),5'-bisphosphate nucleotidase 1 [Venturia canescens]|uniref:3'(2'),5'-bisphosphate nucleotidase 1 n=1 Tax=Venturia canescens TaxID=32260 RepID=UPI001C9C51C2|nr:3'(2'),5'-bisphosphate nucleotidase 1 [Venturia canescens]XP_043274163.1 3'(2'),5'-bisphosphate nucleotidase 1 [Venturia canescens]